MQDSNLRPTAPEGASRIVPLIPESHEPSQLFEKIQDTSSAHSPGIADCGSVRSVSHADLEKFAAPVQRSSRLRLDVLDGGADDMLSVRQVAKKLGVSTATVYKLCDRGELPHIRVLNSIRVAPEDLAAFIQTKKERRR